MLKNSTKKTIISKKTKICSTILSKTIGLMFSRKQERALIFVFRKEIRESLHMFFVFYPIDVIFLNKDKKVVEIKKNFRPFAVYLPRNRAKYIIEAPAGSVKRSKTRVGDKISF
jgi:uncharacterized membrane protein (UPF0127 family)